MNPDLKDASLNQTFALPNGAATTYGADIDLGATTGDRVSAGHEFEVTIPNFAVGNLANSETVTINLYSGAAAEPTTIEAGTLAVYTGAGGVGATGSTFRVKVPSDCPRYIRFGAVKTGATGDASSLSATVNRIF